MMKSQKYFMLNFVHFSETKSPGFASPLFSKPEFLNITLNTRRLKSRAAENIELTDTAIWRLKNGLSRARIIRLDPPHQCKSAVPVNGRNYDQRRLPLIIPEAFVSMSVENYVL